jgi:chromosome segregation ATPase
MKVKRSAVAVIVGMMLFIGRAWAQDDEPEDTGNVTPATAALQDVLSNLKQSVEKLSLDNDQLQARDNSIKQQISQLQTQLRQLEAQADLLNKDTDRLKDNNPRRAQQIARLEEKNSELDDRIQKTEGSIKSIQQSLDTEDQQLPKMSPSAFLAAEHSQKEKLKLMKMVYDSQQRQESLHEAISEFQKNAPRVVANQGDDAQLLQLESELKDLEQNYSQLKDLMEKMSRKAQSSRMTISQHIEGEKLQSSIDDLNRQGVGLKVDLDDLRSQMVDLDKRKSYLETVIKQLP